MSAEKAYVNEFKTIDCCEILPIGMLIYILTGPCKLQKENPGQFEMSVFVLVGNKGKYVQ